MATYLTSFLLFVLPFIVFPIGSNLFEAPKVFAAEIATELLTVWWLLKYKISFKTLPKTFLTPIVIFFVLSLIDLIFLNTKTTFFGNAFRLQGVFLLWHLLIFSLISSQIEFKIPKFLPLLSLLFLLLVALFMGLDLSDRALGTLGESNALAATAVFLWPLAYFNFPTKFNKIKIVVFLMGLIIMGLSGSRSGLIAMGIEAIFLSLNKFNLKLITLVGVGLILATYLLPFLGDPGKFENRSQIWQTAVASGLESPIIGHGFGNVEQALKTTSQRINNNVQYNYVDSAHNIFLDFWVESGIIGLAALLALLHFSFKNYLKKQKIMELMLLLGLIAVLSFNPASVVTLVALWWLLGSTFKTG